MIKSRNVNMDFAISIAAYIIEMLQEDYLDVNNWFKYYDVLEIALKKWKKPEKETLVHCYIKDLYLNSLDYTLDKHFPVEVIDEIQNLLENYNVDYSTIGKIDISGLPFDEYTDELRDYAYKLREFLCDEMLDIIVDDVFSVLYMDKNFLYEFNRQCSEIIRYLKKSEYSDLKIFGENGAIERATPPGWLKKGIEYRDKGRCSLCGCNLSTSFTMCDNKNFDHIIPLKLGGNNDPSNWQLTCEKCNKTKGARNSEFKNIVFPFWEDKEKH